MCARALAWYDGRALLGMFFNVTSCEQGNHRLPIVQLVAGTEPILSHVVDRRRHSATNKVMT